MSPRRFWAVAASLLLCACASRAPVGDGRPVSSTRMSPVASEPARRCANCPTPDPDYAPTVDEVPADVASTPDAVPREEPRSKYGNPPSYEALGERYEVMTEVPRLFRETGKASWYGKKFHGRRTANGEKYNMFAMTAAHKTLPLPTYARVTNVGNGRSVVVKINDRGPFHPGRIVDLSYAAAAKIDLLHHGSTDVVLEVLSPDQGSEAIDSARERPRYLEVGRFDDPIEAIALQERLAKLGLGKAELKQRPNAAGDGDEQVLRLGPFKDFARLEQARARLQTQKIMANPVAE
ncbi:MAG: septal ring lytic transglycosylase RlpA family protein [Stagnimonas sp.]|nr:septal ring lytic transglycosylase RlpA family protein [Stagnimonas sp.]